MVFLYRDFEATGGRIVQQVEVEVEVQQAQQVGRQFNKQKQKFNKVNKWAEGSTSRGHSDCYELIQSNVQLDLILTFVLIAI